MQDSIVRLLSPLSTIRKRLNMSRSTDQSTPISDTTIAKLRTPDSNNLAQQGVLSPTTSSPDSPDASKQATKKQKSRVKKKLCVSTCKFQGKDTDHMVQCHLCQLWVHFKCVGEKEQEVIGLWCCHMCRNIGKAINSLHEKVSVLDNTVKTLQENNSQLTKLIADQCKTEEEVRNENCALKEQLSGLREELACLSSQGDLHAQMAQMSTEFSDLKDLLSRHIQRAPARAEEPEATPREEIRLLCDGQLRDITNVTSESGDPVQVSCTPQATLKDICTALNEETTGTKAIVLMCGSTEVQSDQPVEDVKRDYKSLLAKAKTITDNIRVGSIVPGSNEKETMRADDLNKFLQTHSQEIGAIFTDCQTSMVFRDGTRDQSAFIDGTMTLSENGARRVLRGLGFSLSTIRHKSRKAPARDTRHTVVHQRKNPGHKSGRPYRPYHGQCSTCGETNHVTSNCRHKSKVVCQDCGVLGHKSKHHRRPANA